MELIVLSAKENNLRIRFDDTSATTGFAANDWQITANDEGSGGSNKFSIEDISHGTTPFTIRGQAPSDSLYVNIFGNIGIHNPAPLVDLHLKSADTPAIRIEQTNVGGSNPQIYDLAGLVVPNDATQKSTPGTVLKTNRLDSLHAVWTIVTTGLRMQTTRRVS